MYYMFVLLSYVLYVCIVNLLLKCLQNVNYFASGTVIINIVCYLLNFYKLCCYMLSLLILHNIQLYIQCTLCKVIITLALCNTVQKYIVGTFRKFVC